MKYAWGYLPIKNKIKENFAKVIGYPHPLGRIAAKIVCSYANFNSYHTLDIGVDAGIYTIEFLRRGVKKVSGIDINASSVEIAKENLRKVNLYADIINADAQNLPYEDNTFDQVICLMIMEHVENPIALVNEISRVLIPGGKLILSVPNELYLTKSITPYDFSDVLEEIGHEHAGFYLEDLQEIFKSSYLDIKEHRYYNKFFSRFVTEIIYRILGVKKRGSTRKNMIEASFSAMFMFSVIYPIFMLDQLSPEKRGGCIVVKAIKK
jgi:ubiquinone/menaquinone biosynthesis C-methylase UbiE